MSEEVKKKVIEEMATAWSKKEVYAINASHICDLTEEELYDILFTMKSKVKAIKDAGLLKNLSTEEVGKLIKELGEK